MESIAKLLPPIKASRGKVTNKSYALAEEIAKVTGEPVVRRLREVKTEPWASEVALRALKERIKILGKPKNPAAYYTSLYHKFKEEGRC